MTSPKQTIRLLVAAAAVAATLSSCSNKATEEQMKTLRDLDQRRDGLVQDLDRAKNTLRDAQGNLAVAPQGLSPLPDGMVLFDFSGRAAAVVLRRLPGKTDRCLAAPLGFSTSLAWPGFLVALTGLAAAFKSIHPRPPRSPAALQEAHQGRREEGQEGPPVLTGR